MVAFKRYLTILLFLPMLLIGQDFIRTHGKLGIMGGGAYNTQVKQANQIAPVSYWYYNVTSPYLGLIYRDSLSNRFVLRVGLYYVKRGVKFHYRYTTSDYTLDVKSKFDTHYISFPIKLNYNYKSFFIGGGVEGSILIRGHFYQRIEETLDPNYRNLNTLDKWYGSKQFQPIDAGWCVNFGYTFKKNFEIEFAMYHGLLQPGKFSYFSWQHFEFKYGFQQTFTLGLNYFPVFKKSKVKNN